MNLIEKNVKRALAVSAAASVMSLVAPTYASENIVAKRDVAYLAYDWLNTDKTAESKTVSLSVKERRRLAANIAKHGNGSYICSPSGFGKKSHCYTR